MQTLSYNPDDNQIDAEGEEDTEIDYAMGEAPHSDGGDDAEASDAAPSAESEDEDIDTADEEERPKRPSRTSKSRKRADSDEDVAVEEASDAEESSAGEENNSDKDSSDAESAAAEKWEGGSDSGDEGEVEVATRNNCMYVLRREMMPRWTMLIIENRFCLQDEEHDPCEEFEEYMACAVCGDNCE